MKPEELRVGNWVNNHDEDYQITWATIAQLERGESTVRPIILTEEWLKRFGFDGPCEDEGGILPYYKLGRNRVYLFNQETDMSFFEFEYSPFPVKLFNLFKTYRYVHQLQNIVYILLEEELKIHKDDQKEI